MEMAPVYNLEAAPFYHLLTFFHCFRRPLMKRWEMRTDETLRSAFGRVGHTTAYRTLNFCFSAFLSEGARISSPGFFAGTRLPFEL